MLLSARVKVRERSPARSQGATSSSGPQSGHAQETKLPKARRTGANVKKTVVYLSNIPTSVTKKTFVLVMSSRGRQRVGHKTCITTIQCR